MAYNEALTERVRTVLARKRNIVEKRMFGGVGFLLNGNMCVGIWKDSLVARIGPEQYRLALTEPDVMPFDITGRAMTGWVLVKPAGIEPDKALKAWINRSMKFVSQLIPK